MKKKKNVLPEFSVMHKIRLGAVRAEQVRQGIFDGRFRTKSVPSKRYLTENELKVKRFKKVFNSVKSCITPYDRIIFLQFNL